MVLEMDFTPAERRVFTLRAGDVVLAEASGSAAQVGRAAIWRDEIPSCCYQNTVLRFRPHAVVPDYALLVFRYYATAGIFANVSRGVGIQHLGTLRFSQIPFPLPPLREQIRIAGEADRRLVEIQAATKSLYSALHRIQAQDHEILAAAVAGTLVENETVLAAREARPVQDGGSLLRVAGLRRDEQRWLFDTSEEVTTAADNLRRRQRPPGWVWARVAQLGEARLGKQLSPSEARGPQLRKYLRVANVFEDFIDTTDVKHMHFSDEEYEAYRLRPGDLLLNEGQSLDLAGRPAIFRGELPAVCFQNTLIRFRVAPALDPEYALLVFRHYLHAGEFRKIARRSTNIAHLGLLRFAGMPFPLPPRSEQRRIVEEARRRLDDSRAQLEAVRASLDRFRVMETELFAAAVVGALVPQDATDEPGASLLERLGLPPSDVLETTGPLAIGEEGVVVKMPRRSVDSAVLSTIALAEVLREAGRPLRLPDLFSAAGYDSNSTEHIEHFYLALRAELGRSIRKVGDDAENGLLEVITDAP